MNSINMILQPDQSFLKKKACLLVAASLLVAADLSGQVVSNKGAHINLFNGVMVSSDNAYNDAGGHIRNNGTLRLWSDYTSTAETSGDGIFTIGRNWTNTGTLYLGESTVIFNGTGLQTVTRPSGEAFYNMSVRNSGSDPLNRILLANDVNVNGTLTLFSGNILPGTNILYLTNPSASSLSYISSTGSRVIGKFEREMDETNNYLFPVGSLSNYNPLNLKPNSILFTGSLLSEFLVSPLPGNSGLPLADAPVEIFRTFPSGFWNLKANGFSTDDFDINLNATGFTDTVTTVTRVLKRTNSGDWEVDGTHKIADTVASVVFRDNIGSGISSFGTQFALGRVRPLIVKQPQDTLVCEDTYPVFTVIATGAPALKYVWYKEPGLLLENGIEYSGVRTHSLTINNVQLDDTGRYYCIITDRYHNSTRTENAVLRVNKIPVASATPGNQDHECSDVPFVSILLNEEYGVPGSTYFWTRDNPDDISSILPMSGDSLNIGDLIPGMFTNSGDEPRTVTFTITPVGPWPTYCTGLPVKATVRVNPVPRATPVNVKPAICYGGYTSIELKSPTKMTMGNIKFDYTVNVTDIITLRGDTTRRKDLGPGYISLRYTNSSDTLQSVYYNIIPKVDSDVCAPGPVNIQEVKVHAIPVQDIITLESVTCLTGSNGLGALQVVTSKGAEPFKKFTWTGPFGYSRKDSVIIRKLQEGRYTIYIEDNLNCPGTQFEQVLSIQVNPYLVPAPKAPTDLYNVSCIGSNDGSLLISATGGITPPYNYSLYKNHTQLISSGVFTDNYDPGTASTFREITGLGAGTYTLVLTDINGCVTSGEQDMVPPDPMKVTFGKKHYGENNEFDISCKGYDDGQVWVASVSGGNGWYKYRWYTKNGFTIPAPVNKDTIHFVEAGWYYLDVTDSLNCTITDSVEVIEPAGMVRTGFRLSQSADGFFNISCNGGNNGKIDIDIEGGSKPYVYKWTGPSGLSATTRNIENLHAGVYVDSVYDFSGCLLKPLPVFDLKEPAPLRIGILKSKSVNGNYEINCNGGVGTVDITVTGGSVGNYTYAWRTDDGSGIIPGMNQPALKAGTYHLLVTDLNGCTADSTIVMTQPPAMVLDLMSKDVTCEIPGFSNGSVDMTVTGGVAPFIYAWSNSAATEDITGLTAGRYTVKVTYNNTCFANDTAYIKLPPPLTYNKTIRSYHSYEISCFGQKDGEISVVPTSGKAPFTYLWTGPAGFSSVSGNISGLGAGDYTIKITDANLCFVTETITLREPGQLGLEFALSNSIAGDFNINCAGASTGEITVQPLNSVNNVSFLWSDGATGRTRKNLPAGEYTVVITDENNCQASASATLRQPDSLKLKFDATPPFCPDKPDGEISLIVTGGVMGSDYSYKWSDNSTGKVVTDVLKGLYAVRVEDLNKCSIKDSIYIEPRNESCLIIPNVISPNSDLVNDEWNIGMKDLYPSMEVTIFNRWGETVWKSDKGYTKPWDGRSNGRLLPIDSYHYIINLHNGTKPVLGNITIVR